MEKQPIQLSLGQTVVEKIILQEGQAVIVPTKKGGYCDANLAQQIEAEKLRSGISGMIWCRTEKNFTVRRIIGQHQKYWEITKDSTFKIYPGQAEENAEIITQPALQKSF